MTAISRLLDKVYESDDATYSYLDRLDGKSVFSYDEDLDVITEARWSAGVETKWSSPPGLFQKSGKEIASGLRAAGGGLKKAMSRLNFYANRAGKNLSSSDRARLEAAKTHLQKGAA